MISEVKMAASIQANSTRILEAMLKKCWVENALASIILSAKMITVEISMEVNLFLRNLSLLKMRERLIRKLTTTTLTTTETIR